MGNLQVKNIPETLHRRLKKHAQKHGSTLSDFVRQAIEKELARSEFHERIAKRTSTNLGVSAASLLEDERDERREELG
jgi:plasmid stability protein